MYVQELRRVHRERERLPVSALYVVDAPPSLRELRRDPRNLVPVAHGCHGAHHARSRPFPVRVLPDSVFEFACELLGAGAAYEYLRRRYSGQDLRLEALLLS